MGYNIPAGYSRVVFEYGAESPNGSQICFGLGIDQGPSPTTLDVFEEWWTESLKLVTGVGYTLQRIEARNNIEVLDRTIGEAGLLNEPMLPPNNAVLVNLGSGLVGRSFRGRIFIPGVCQEEEIDEAGQLSSTHRDQMQGVMNYLGALIADAGRTIRILHSGPGTPTLVLSANVNAQIATQRRRLRR